MLFNIMEFIYFIGSQCLECPISSNSGGAAATSTTGSSSSSSGSGSSNSGGTDPCIPYQAQCDVLCERAHQVFNCGYVYGVFQSTCGCTQNNSTPKMFNFIIVYTSIMGILIFG